MKKSITIIVLIIFLCSNYGFTLANGGNKRVENRENTIASLLEGLKSDNSGLKSSAAYMLGELKVTSAVIPLMRVLRNDASEQVRISAALALYKIGTPLSINAVKQAIRFDKSERVNKLAQNFYSEYLRNRPDKRINTDNYFAHSE